jgi:hypothetical protein
VYLSTQSKEIIDETFPTTPWLGFSATVPPNPETRLTDNLFMRFNDESMANRVVEAFRRAAVLCQKKEAF